MLGWLLVLLGVLGIAGNLDAGGATFYAADFGLDDSAMAATLAWLAVGSILGAFLSPQMDRVGRRRLLLVSVAGLSTAALATALAPSLLWFIVAQIGAGAFGVALLSTANVLISEELPTAARARGQARAALVFQLGGGASFLLIAAVEDVPGTWRWAWSVVGVPLLLLPFLARKFRETQRFLLASANDHVARGRVGELFLATYRARTLAALVTSLLIGITANTAHLWLLYYPEEKLGISVSKVTAAVILAGAVGLVGYPLGAFAANRLGRRLTVLVFGIGFTGAMTAYYWVPASASYPPLLILGTLFGLGSICYGAELVAARTAMTELFPTRLRGTFQGLNALTGSIAFVGSQFAVAGLAGPLGGLSQALTLVLLVGGCGFILFYLLIPETAGLELDEAALETSGSVPP